MLESSFSKKVFSSDGVFECPFCGHSNIISSEGGIYSFCQHYVFTGPELHYVVFAMIGMAQ